MFRFARPAVFGAFDGLTVVLGVLFSLAGAPRLVLPTAVGVAVAEGVGMAAGEWLSESDSGFAASAVIGAATMTGSVLPAVPYAVVSGRAAVAGSVVVFAALGVVISAIRARQRGWRRALVETFGVLVAVAVAVAVCEAVTPRGAV